MANTSMNLNIFRGKWESQDPFDFIGATCYDSHRDSIYPKIS